MSAEDRAAAKARGAELIANLKKQAGKHKDLARRERKVAKLNTMGADATPEKKRMRTVVYKGGDQSAGSAWNPNGKRRAK